MKKIFIPFVIAATTLSFAACQKEASSPAIEDELVSLNFTSANPTTKTVADAVNKTILWEKGDKISIAYTVNDNWQNATGDATTNKSAKIYVSEGLDTGGETAVFNISGSFNSTATGVHQFYSVYPSSCVKSTDIKYAPSVTMTIPGVQTPAENSFDAAADLMIGKATKTYNSLSDAKKDEIPLLWQRIVSHADITLKGLQGLTENEVITTIVLTADADAKLVGERNVNIQNGDISMPATIADANVLTINGTNLKINNNNVEFWAAVMPATIKSLNIVVETNKATYTRNIESCNIEFKQNARKGLNVDMSKVERVEKEAPASWIATDLADITATDEVVITMAKDKSVYALTSAKGSSAAPTAVAVTVTNKELTATPTDNLVWNVANADGNITIYPKGQTTKWLYTTNTNNGVRVGTNDNKTFVVDPEFGYLKNTTTNRYLGVYNNSDWRCYDNMHANIAGQTLCFYVKGTPKTALETPANLQVSAAKVVSWNAVSGAASYEVTIGENTFASETTSYEAADIADDYYDVAVVAVPSDKENYKNSAAATLTGVKFGTPTLATPTLKEGVIDGASISVSWSVDERATAGYNCELFKGGAKVGESQTVNAGAVTFTGLDAETAYVVKVNAIAVEGAKAYAASSVATLEVTTKAASATANDGSLEHPYTAAEAIAAIDANTGLTGKHVKGIVTEVVSHDPSYGSMVYIIKSGEKTLKIFNGYDFGHTKFLGTDDLKVGDEVVVFGDLIKYKTTYELNTNNYLISINGETQIYRGLAVSGQKTAFTVGDAFEFGGKALQVWRGKEDVDVTASATFSGYNMSTEGKQTVTVTVGEETVTYEITINPAGTVLSTTVVKNISEISGTTTNGTQVSSMTMDDVITLSASTNGNNGKVYNKGTEWRLYQTNNGTMTVSSKAGYVIESITVTFTVSNKGALLYNSTAVTSGKAVAVSGSSVKFTLGNTGTAKNGLIKITAISVTYKQQ